MERKKIRSILTTLSHICHETFFIAIKIGNLPYNFPSIIRMKESESICVK